MSNCGWETSRVKELIIFTIIRYNLYSVFSTSDANNLILIITIEQRTNVSYKRVVVFFTTLICFFFAELNW